MPRARLTLPLAVAGALSLLGCTGAQPPSPTSTSSISVPAPTGLRVETVVDGLENPWDVGVLPDGALLVTERPGRLSLVSSGEPGATVTAIAADLDDVGARGEGGLMGLWVHPDFAQSRQFTTCQTHAEGADLADIRLVTWRLSADRASAVKVADLLTGLPVAGSGRHSGCRLALSADGGLLVGTGDTARGDLPQDLTSLGGKVLRINPETGEGLPDNPFGESTDPNERRIISYGHRNVQGLAVQPGTGELYTVEHGPSTDDEVNRIVPAGNYGWDPSRGGTQGGYDESVPMTDLTRFPDAIPAIWSTGTPTQALAGAAFLDGPAWDASRGLLAVAALKGSRLILVDVTTGAVQTPAALDGEFGRLRAVVPGGDGILYVTTSNGENDRILRVTPN